MPEGDPTADDQPSPAPKKSARFGNGNSLQIRESVEPIRVRSSRMKWDLYLRILSRLTLR